MAASRTNKAFRERLKTTKRGKALHRHIGQNHYQAKQKRRKQLQRDHWVSFHMSRKKLGHYLPFDL
jgi:ribosomal protein L35